MKGSAKTIVLVVLSLLVIAGACGGGAYWAIIVANKMDKVNFCSQVYVQAQSSQLVLEHIDQNEIEKGHHLLMSQLAGDIMFLDDMRKNEEDEVMKMRIGKLLQKIARHRDEFPENYRPADSQSQETKESMAIVNKTLQKYKM